MQKTIGVVGLWHLGCVIATTWAKLGNKVIGFDYETLRVDNLIAGYPPLFEPGLKESIAENVNARKLLFRKEIDALSGCDFVFLSYDTPVRDDDSSDTTILMNSMNDLKKVMKDGAILLISSQSPVGFCSQLRKALKGWNNSLDLAYSPENLRLGEALQCYMNPGRIILGTADPETRTKCCDLFSSIDASVVCMNLESAEMVKHGINSFLANSIVFANHLADLCESTGAKIDDVVKGMKSDPRIGARSYLSPGIGFSGGTLGRDLKVLQSENQAHDGFAKLFGVIHQLNTERKTAIAQKVKKILGNLEGHTVAILGITYKPGTSTLRRSLPLEIVDLLLADGAVVRVFDPKADYSELPGTPRFTICESTSAALEKADLALLLTEWQEFKTIDWKRERDRMSHPVIFDAKNALDGSQLQQDGFTYFSVGR